VLLDPLAEGIPSIMSRSSVVPEAPARLPGQPWNMREAAKFLGISARTLEQLAKVGTVKTYHLGSRRFVTDAEVRRVASGGAS
jgi:hypothetical protein